MSQIYLVEVTAKWWHPGDIEWVTVATEYDGLVRFPG